MPSAAAFRVYLRLKRKNNHLRSARANEPKCSFAAAALLVLISAIVVLAGCAAQKSYHEGRSCPSRRGANEAALTRLQAAVQTDPRNVEYRLAFLTARDA